MQFNKYNSKQYNTQYNALKHNTNHNTTRQYNMNQCITYSVLKRLLVSKYSEQVRNSKQLDQRRTHIQYTCGKKSPSSQSRQAFRRDQKQSREAAHTSSYFILFVFFGPPKNSGAGPPPKAPGGEADHPPGEAPGGGREEPCDPKCFGSLRPWEAPRGWCQIIELRCWL